MSVLKNLTALKMIYKVFPSLITYHKLSKSIIQFTFEQLYNAINNLLQYRVILTIILSSKEAHKLGTIKNGFKIYSLKIFRTSQSLALFPLKLHVCAIAQQLCPMTAQTFSGHALSKSPATGYLLFIHV